MGRLGKLPEVTADTTIAARLRAHWEASRGFDQLMGVELVAVSADRVELALPVTSELLQPYGILHGGVLCSLVETAGSIAAATWFGERGQVVGTANATDFLRPVADGKLRAVATPIHRGRSQQLWLVEVSDDRQRLVARGQLRLANLPGGRFGPDQDRPAS